MTFENFHDFPRNMTDAAAPLLVSIYGLFLPFSRIRIPDFLHYPGPPDAQYGFGEITGSVGILTLLTFSLAIIVCIFLIKKGSKINTLKRPAIIGILLILAVFLAVGNISDFSPYGLIKHIPIISDMRVSTRWYIWADLLILIFIGLVSKLVKRISFEYFMITILLLASCLELFFLNIGYQSQVLTYEPIKSSYRKDLPFNQQTYFGSVQNPDFNLSQSEKSVPKFYHEYNSMLLNMGVLYANDSFVQIALANKTSPRCGLDIGCSFIMSKNAKVIFWSPNKIILERIDTKNIILNANESNYMLINGKRSDIKISEPFRSFIIKDKGAIITIEMAPSMLNLINNVAKPKPSSDYN